ncbi:PQQ-dependent sugar dehydrogenase [Nocardioides acrostichi]|uniref:PQQ-dependent sugar dehydrogenase n=1 Tax=Nocardioides acrostichi TaxID=2784339 RepID=A0A930Y6G3_9ACTN|nr:PQQ-dependent sugar dehydrogenase [Nocardioides acrostichi]MBF4160911.1 PQQ-dependent sugar dehydrogenase [Nocardioides acrostichi]
MHLPRRARQVSLGTGLTLALALGTTVACNAEDAGRDPAPSGPSASSSASVSGQETEPANTASPETDARGVPDLKVTTIAEGLDHPWDAAPIGNGALLFTQRERATLSVLTKGGTVRTVDFPSENVWVSGETGLMGLAVDPNFAKNRRFYTCQGATTSTGHDVRVKAWKLSDDGTKALRRGTLVAGFPTSSGRHGGCRLLVADDGALHVGTGDAAIGTNPENLRSLGGKTLRLNRFTGKPWPGNPFAKATNQRKRYVYTYGHRNVQGLAQRNDGTVWNVEHGSYRDDEVNKLVKGGDYGWNPVSSNGSTTYDESVPMTDFSLPGRQVGARWRSGDPTVAPSGGTFVYGKKWGGLRGTMAVGVLKDTEVLFLRFDSRGRLKGVKAPQSLKQYGRIRQVVQIPGNDVVLLTDNGDGNDVILRVSPR